MSRIALLAGLLAALAPGDADAEVIMYIYQSGSNVITSGSGSVNTTDLTLLGPVNDGAQVIPVNALLIVGPTGSPNNNLYGGISGPMSFGDATASYPSSGSGDTFGVYGSIGGLFLPTDYTSGANLSGTDTYDSTTLAGLGLTAGQTYTYTWGTGGHQDSLVVNTFAPPSAVPEPASLVLCGLGGLTVVVATRLRRRRAPG